MKKQTKEELFDILYSLEIKFDFDETETGKRIGLLINKLQEELLSNENSGEVLTPINSQN